MQAKKTGAKKAPLKATPPRVISKKTVTVTQQEPPEPSADILDNEFNETEDLRSFAGYDSVLRSYMETAGGPKTYYAELYKYDSMAKQKQYVVNASENAMMTAHDVGMAFGSGEYRYLVTFSEESGLKPKAFRFNIHPVYDEYRQKAGLSSLPDPRAATIGRNNISDTLEIMKSLAAVFKEMMPAQITAPPPVQTDPFQGMLGAYEMMQAVMKKNLLDTSQLYREMNERNKPGEKVNQEIEEDEGPSLVDRFLPLLEKVIPFILGPGPAGAAVVAGVKAAPEFAGLLKDKAQLFQAINELDSKIGKEETDKVLKRFGIKRPAAQVVKA